MIPLPLGVSAYERRYGQEPEVELFNRFFEQTPTNQIEESVLLARPGNTLFLSVGIGPIRKLATQDGVFNGDLFIVSDDALFRYDGETLLSITGIIQGTGQPTITFVAGAGYEHMFVGDGINLQYYDGEAAASGVLTVSGDIDAADEISIGTVFYQWSNGDVDAGTPLGTDVNPYLINMDQVFATSTLTSSGGNISDADVVSIGITPVYYEWTDGDVDSGSPAGTALNPWLVARETTDATALANLRLALGATGAPGIDYSTGLTANGDVVPTANGAKTLDVRAATAGTVGNTVGVTVETGATLAWDDATLLGGELSNEGALANLIAALNNTGVGGTDYSSSVAEHTTVEGVLSTETTANIRARDRGTGGNSITVTVETGADIAWGAATLEGGGDQALNGVITPDDVGIVSLETIASFVVAVVSNSQRFYWIQPGSTEIDALDFAEAESEPDELIEVVRIGDALYFFGQSSTEVWYVSGTQDIPFQRQQGLAFSQGAREGTAVAIRTQAVVVAEDGKVYQIVGGPQRLSHNGIEERIRLAAEAEA